MLIKWTPYWWMVKAWRVGGGKPGEWMVGSLESGYWEALRVGGGKPLE